MSPKRNSKRSQPQSGAPGSDQSPYEMVIAVAESGQLSETAPVVDSGLVEGACGRWSLNLGGVTVCRLYSYLAAAPSIK
jgi:hypothetical protein